MNFKGKDCVSLEWTNEWTIPASEELNTFVAPSSSSTQSVVSGRHLLYGRGRRASRRLNHSKLITRFSSREVAGVSIVAAGSPRSVVDTFNCRQPIGLNIFRLRNESSSGDGFIKNPEIEFLT